MDATSGIALPPGVFGTRLPWLLPNVPAHVLPLMRPHLLFVRGLTAEDRAVLEEAALTSTAHHEDTGGSGGAQSQPRRHSERSRRGTGAARPTCHAVVEKVQQHPIGLSPTGFSAPQCVFADLSIPARISDHCEVIVVEVGYCSDSSFVTRLTEKHMQHVALVAALKEAGWKVHSGRACVVLLGTAGTIFQPLQNILQHLGVTSHDVQAGMRTLHRSAVLLCDSIVRDRHHLEHLSFEPP